MAPGRRSYEAPIQRVDDALSRLTATLASYKVTESGNGAKMVDPKRPVSSGSSTPSNPDSITESQFDYERDFAHLDPPGLFDLDFDVNTKDLYPNITNDKLRVQLNTLHGLTSFIAEWPYSIPLYDEIARVYIELGYPDLAVGTAYKALLLLDAANDESDEYHEEAIESVRAWVQQAPLGDRVALGRDSGYNRWNPDHPDAKRDGEGYMSLVADEEEAMLWIRECFSLSVYGVLAQALHVVGCQRSALKYVQMGLNLFPGDEALLGTQQVIMEAVDAYFTRKYGKNTTGQKFGPEDFPDSGMVRREAYPWNEHEPDRSTKESLDFLNEEMAKVAPKLEVRVTELPALSTEPGKENETTKQLGVFAKDDIAPGEIVLNETSLLTANNRLQDALCDACSKDLPDLNSSDAAASEVVECDDCQVVFCSQRCLDLAQETYHPALCDVDVEAIAKDVPPAQAADALYTLLLLRAMAMAETQDCHPLELKEVKYIWGDYHTMPLSPHWQPHDPYTVRDIFPKTLPFSFHYSVELPFHMLEKMDVDFFRNPQYDTWVFNVLYAKFHGTASARLSGLGGRPIRGPEVSAVHPMWCLANHSCDPNVSWEWGGAIFFQARKERVEWRDGKGETRKKKPGLKRDEEVLNHYCDVELPVKERREWASGALGGDCRCDRCVWEAGEVAA